MGISFVYIGRDENTLKDMLPVEKLGDQLPLELGGGSAYGFDPATANKTGVAAVPGFLGVDPNTITELNEPLKPIAFSRGPRGGQGNNNPVMAQLLSPGNPTTQKMLQSMLPTLLPSLSKDFKLSDMFPPGGIVTSEMDVLLAAVQKDHPSWLSKMPPTFKQPQNESTSHAAGPAHQDGTVGGHGAMIRAIYRLDNI